MEMSHVCGRNAGRHLFCFTSAVVLILFSKPPGYVMYQKKNTVLYILISFINHMNSQLILMISSLVNFFFQKSSFCFCHTSAPVWPGAILFFVRLQPFYFFFGASCFTSIYQMRCACHVFHPNDVFALNQSYL